MIRLNLDLTVHPFPVISLLRNEDIFKIKQIYLIFSIFFYFKNNVLLK